LKTIGLLGGMSWESTATYYRLINVAVKERLGGLHSGKIVLYSVDFEEIDHLQHRGEWHKAGRALAEAAVRVEAAGADFLAVCTNTMHKIAPEIECAVAIPLLHIADATAEAVRASGIDRVGLLGTRFTMEQGFYRGRMAERYGVEVLIPEEAERQTIHRVIYEELCQGRVTDDSRVAFVKIIEALADRGARGVVLGCTEIPLLVGPADSPIPVFDTTEIHARRAVEWALEDLA
jgi:aspartate racemase